MESECYRGVGPRLCQERKRVLQKCGAKILTRGKAIVTGVWGNVGLRLWQQGRRLLHKCSAKIEARGGGKGGMENVTCKT
jgi:hypothetical protein